MVFDFVGHIVGGAISNLYAVAAARHKYFPDVKTQGLFNAPRMVMFTSEQVSLLV